MLFLFKHNYVKVIIDHNKTILLASNEVDILIYQPQQYHFIDPM